MAFPRSGGSVRSDEVVVFPNVYERCLGAIHEGSVVAIRGTAGGGSAKLKADDVELEPGFGGMDFRSAAAATAGRAATTDALTGGYARQTRAACRQTRSQGYRRTAGQEGNAKTMRHA